MNAAKSNSETRRQRVMLFTDSFIHGGTERQLLETLRHLDRARFDVRVGCLKQRGPFLSDVEALGVPVVEFPIASIRSLGALEWIAQVRSYFRREQIDVVHAFDFYTDVLAVPAARLAGVPAVIASRRNLGHHRSAVERAALRTACQMAHAVVANSQAAAVTLAGWSSRPAHARVIHNAIEPADYLCSVPLAELRARLGLPGDAVLVGAVGALRREKGHKLFLRAAAAAAKQQPGLRFVLVGDGPERPGLEEMARQSGLNGRVVFAGDQRNVAEWMSALDIVVHPSDFESLPNAVLEAMASGRAVVATRVGGTPELIEEGVNGHLVPVGDAEAVAQRVVELARDGERRRAMGAAGRARIARDFTPRRMAQKLEGLYNRLLREARPSARLLQISNYPPPLCGWALHTELVDRALQERGADSRVMDIGPGRRIEGRECIPVHSGLDYFAKLLAYRLRGFTFQMHVNGDSWKGYVMALAAVQLGRLTGKAAVLTFHAGPVQLYFPRVNGFWRWAFQLLFHMSGEIICNHDPVKKLIVGYGVPDKKVHPIPAYSVQYHEEIPVPLAPAVEGFLQARQPRIFSYSLFRPEFTMDALFAAFAAVRLRYPNAGLLLAGPKETPPEAIAEMRRLGIEASVLIPGNLAHAEFLTAVERSDVFVRTHLRDGVCTSVLEALQLGVPVVAAEDGLRPPSVITYAPGDAAALAQAMEGVLSDVDAARARVQRPPVDNHLDDEVALLMELGAVQAMPGDLPKPRDGSPYHEVSTR